MVFQRAGEYADRDKAASYLIVGATIAIVVCLLMLVLIIPIDYLFQYGFSRSTLGSLRDYFSNIFTPGYLYNGYTTWASKKMMTHQIGLIMIPFLPFITAVI